MQTDSLETYIRERLQQRKVLLMTHAVVGYPSLEANWQMLEIMQEAGVDLVELQMPFSEPNRSDQVMPLMGGPRAGLNLKRSTSIRE
ncbi:MAG: tryptophan synthase subunit alpha [SAR324 cluster bacterium]|nr:tryptophan synthase subunit alpha [SAR324 cluster bacterium]